MMMRDVADGLQRVIEGLSPGDGWQVADYVVIVGAQRILECGGIESMTWALPAPNQAAYVTAGLMLEGGDIVDSMYVSEVSDDE